MTADHSKPKVDIFEQERLHAEEKRRFAAMLQHERERELTRWRALQGCSCPDCIARREGGQQ